MIISYILTCIYFSLACGRTTEFLKHAEKIIRKKKPNEKDRHIKEQAVLWMEEQNMEKIQIQGKDDVKLAGHLLLNPNAKRIILMFHGWRGSWNGDCVPLAQKLYEEGCSVLLIEQRAHDTSGGKYIGFGILERYDCQKWSEYLAKRFKEIPIYLAGISMGASTVLMASSLNLPKQVKGVIADCGYISPYEMVCIYGKKFMHLKGHLAVDKVNRRCVRNAGYNLKEYSTLEAMKNCKIPVFFAHGTKDDFVPYEMSQKNYEMCESKKMLFTVKEAGHTKCFVNDPKKYMDALKMFFQWV